MPDVCIKVATSEVIIANLDQYSALMLSAALEFGEKCSILSTLDSFLGDDLKQLGEDAFKAVMDTLRNTYNTVKAINGLIAAGITELSNYLTSVYNLIFNQLLSARNLMNILTGFIIDAVNTVATQACNTLNEAVTGMPSDVKIQNAGLAAAAAVNKTGKPQEMIKKLLQQRAITDAKNGFKDVISSLRTIPKLPNLSPYICVPV